MRGLAIRLFPLFGVLLVLGGTGKPPMPPHVVILVLDTVRASSVEFFTDGAPVLSGLAAQGVVFENASSTWDYTPPSHHSIFTGYHGGMNTRYDLPQNSMAHHLNALGYRTIGISANGTVSRESMHICEPFETFTDFFTEFEAGGDSIIAANRTRLDRAAVTFDIEPTNFVVRNYLASADWVIDRARDLVPEDPDRPVLLFLNFLDAHDPYLPPPEFYDPADDPRRPEFFSDPRERPLADWETLVEGPEERRKIGFRMMNLGPKGRWKISLDLTPDQLALYRSRYRATVRYLDAKVGEVIDLLRERGIYDNAVIFITSDHGESFGEEDFLTHNFQNQGDFESSRHVPFILVPQKKTLDGPLRVEEPVSIADIKPTVDDLLGIDFRPAAGMEYGRSLAGHIRDYSVPPAFRVPLEFSNSATEDKTRALKERLRSLGYHN